MAYGIRALSVSRWYFQCVKEVTSFDTIQLPTESHLCSIRRIRKAYKRRKKKGFNRVTPIFEPTDLTDASKTKHMAIN